MIEWISLVIFLPQGKCVSVRKWLKPDCLLASATSRRYIFSIADGVPKGRQFNFIKIGWRAELFPPAIGRGVSTYEREGGDVTWSPYQPLEFRYFTHSPFLLQTRTLVWTPQLDSYSLSFCLCQGNFFVHLHCHMNRGLIIHANWYLNSSLCSNLLCRVTTPCLWLT